MGKTKAIYKTTKEALRAVPLPQETRTYKVITNDQLIDLTLNSIVGAGFRVKDERYTSARDGMISNGRVSVASVADAEMCLEIGWQNSYNKQISLKFAIGARIFICENGNVAGDMGAFKKKHQGSVQEFTPTAITEYIKRSGDVFAQMQKDREAMKQVQVTKRIQAELIGRALIEEEFITSTQLNLVADSITKPEFDYGASGSMWELYQFVTEAMRDIHPTLWMENHIKAHDFFVRESGIIVPNAGIVVPSPGSHPQGQLFENAMG